MIFAHCVKILQQSFFLLFVNFTKFFCILFLFLTSKQAMADVRDDALYKTPRVRQFIALGGYYKSNNAGKDRESSFVYGYKSDKHIFEIEGLNEVWWRQTSSKGWHKSRELYDVEASAKTLIKDTKNYLLLYHRTKYDDLSTYYYDISSAVGLGRRFFNEKLDLDVSLGYGDVKVSGYRYTLNVGSRFEHNINKKWRFRQKLSFYSDLNALNETIGSQQLITDNFDVESAIIYRIEKNLSIEFFHSYEKDTYRKTTSKVLRTLTQSDRRYTIRLKIEL